MACPSGKGAVPLWGQIPAAGGGKVPAAPRWLLLTTGLVGLLLEAKGVWGPSAGQSREAVPVGTEGEEGGV